ncbi:NlpC/P60 family protein [Paucilactobacillus wasatchensis]|uniref:NlpC/P60 family protein n=1 Tax=Paucilactobacillus wasatchensis TaxID=1335616 RepID=UPI00177C3CFF
MFDCLPFVHRFFSIAGISFENYTSTITYTKFKSGVEASHSIMRRGIIFFMENVGHVETYFENIFFLHDSPRS